MRMTILLAALAIVESGDLKHPLGNDRAVGKHKEISRYQITPKVWREYVTPGFRPTKKADAEKVARAILKDRINTFYAHVACEPTPSEIYAMWHRPGNFRLGGYRLVCLPKVVQARCERFAAVCRDLEKKEEK